MVVGGLVAEAPVVECFVIRDSVVGSLVVGTSAVDLLDGVGVSLGELHQRPEEHRRLGGAGGFLGHSLDVPPKRHRARHTFLFETQRVQAVGP